MWEWEGVRGYVRVCAGVRRCAWVCAGVRRCVRVCAGMRRCAQVCMENCGIHFYYISKYVGVRGRLHRWRAQVYMCLENFTIVCV